MVRRNIKTESGGQGVHRNRSSGLVYIHNVTNGSSITGWFPMEKIRKILKFQKSFENWPPMPEIDYQI